MASRHYRLEVDITNSTLVVWSGNIFQAISFLNVELIGANVTIGNSEIKAISSVTSGLYLYGLVFETSSIVNSTIHIVNSTVGATGTIPYAVHFLKTPVARSNITISKSLLLASGAPHTNAAQAVVGAAGVFFSTSEVTFSTIRLIGTAVHVSITKDPPLPSVGIGSLDSSFEHTTISICGGNLSVTNSKGPSLLWGMFAASETPMLITGSALSFRGAEVHIVGATRAVLAQFSKMTLQLTSVGFYGTVLNVRGANAALWRFETSSVISASTLVFSHCFCEHDIYWTLY